MSDDLRDGIFREVLEFSSRGRRLAFKANEDTRAPEPPSKLQFRSPAMGGKMSAGLLELLGQALWVRLKALMSLGLKFDYIAGIPKAGDLIADALVVAAAVDGVTLVQLRLIKQQSGKQRKIVGVEGGSRKLKGRVLLVDDVISHGGSKLEAIRILRKAFYSPIGLLVIVDREQGGVKELRLIGIETYALLFWSTMRAYYRANSLMSQKQIAAEEAYLARDRQYWDQFRGPWPDDLANDDYDVVSVGRALMAHNNGCGVDDGCACKFCWQRARITVAVLRRHCMLPIPLARLEPWPRELQSPWAFDLADDDCDVSLVAKQMPEDPEDWTPLEQAKVAVAALRRSTRLKSD